MDERFQLRILLIREILKTVRIANAGMVDIDVLNLNFRIVIKTVGTTFEVTMLVTDVRP